MKARLPQLKQSQSLQVRKRLRRKKKQLWQKKLPAEETTPATPDEEEETPDGTSHFANETTTTAAETTVVETTTRGSTEQILGIEDVSQVLGMILVSLGAVILSALIWLGIRSKRA